MILSFLSNRGGENKGQGITKNLRELVDFVKGKGSENS